MMVAAGMVLAAGAARGATNQARYYAHKTVEDREGVIAPWYPGLNGQCDLRVRIAAETLKRYPWTTTNNAIAAYPHYVFTSKWQIDKDGRIKPIDPGDWMNGDLGQRATSVLNGFVDYYRYTGDPAAIAHVTYMADYIIDHCVTPDDHPWPGLFVSVPTQGKAYHKANPHGMIQLDLVGSTGEGLLRAYQLTGNTRWLEAAKHWADLLAAHCNLDPNADPWPRYAKDARFQNKQTGGVVLILRFLDEVIRLGYTGQDNAIVAARDAGRRYLREKLLPAWWVFDTWARYFWDWDHTAMGAFIPSEAARYMMECKADFPNWRYDARNILTLLLNRTSVNPGSRSDVYSGAWAYPECVQCCGRSLWYSPIITAPTFAQYAVETGDGLCRELAYRQMVLQTYDVHETGVTEDSIDGGIVVNGDWFNIAHPLPLRFMLAAIGWLPEELGASRENHIVRSTAVVNSVNYGDGRIEYATFDAPPSTITVLRLAFAPKKVTADGKKLSRRQDTDANGYTVKQLPNGDAIVTLRHDGAKRIVIDGDDPQQVVHADKLAYEGEWKKESDLRVTEVAGAAVSATFSGNQVRLIGRAEPTGGLADVYVDGVKQLVHADCWNPSPRGGQVLYYRNGLTNGTHELRVVARGERNPYAKGNRIGVEGVQFSNADKACNYPSGTGPLGTQRMIFGYTDRKPIVDAAGNEWLPGTEFVVRSGGDSDSVATWWRSSVTNQISNTTEAELYRYGVHAPQFWVNVTVGPGTYRLKLKFAERRGENDPKRRPMTILVNGQPVSEGLDVAARAGGLHSAFDLDIPDVRPSHGVIEVRLTAPGGEAILQALEVVPRGNDSAGKPERR